MTRNAMLDTGPLSCLRRFQSGRRTKALDVSPRAGHQMGHGEKRAFLHAQTAKDHGKISLKCILRGGPARGKRRMGGGRPASGQRRIRESACKRPAQDKGKRLARGSTPDEGRAPGEEPALTAKVLPTGGSPGGSRASPIGEPRYLIDGILRSASALAFLLRSPFRSQLRQALHRARNR